MDRIEEVKGAVEKIIIAAPPGDQRAAHIHLYGVAQFCALLAMKRGLDVGLCTIAGLLHDCATYATGSPASHAHRGAALARELLATTGLFTAGEIEEVSAAIYAHSDKGGQYGGVAGVLMDADVLQHCLADPLKPPALGEQARFHALRQELGLGA